LQYFIIKEIDQVVHNHDEEKTNSVNYPFWGVEIGGCSKCGITLGALWCNMKDDNKMYVIVVGKNPKIQNPIKN
jgi:hypothetical protein